MGNELKEYRLQFTTVWPLVFINSSQYVNKDHFYSSFIIYQS